MKDCRGWPWRAGEANRKGSHTVGRCDDFVQHGACLVTHDCGWACVQSRQTCDEVCGGLGMRSVDGDKEEGGREDARFVWWVSRRFLGIGKQIVKLDRQSIRERK